MARQSSTPVQFSKSTRRDTAVLMSSARAGKVVPVGYVPLLAGDSASGSVGIDVALKEMPKPLLNAVMCNVQAWFVPKTASPRFAGRDELMASMTGDAIKTLGDEDRDPPNYYNMIPNTGLNVAFRNSEFASTLGLHVPTNAPINSDLLDAYNLVYNFRLAAHSSRLTRRPYAQENISEAASLAPAFWPSSRFARVVPDYERALIVGAMDLDIIAGRLPISGIGRLTGTTATVLTDQTVLETAGETQTDTYDYAVEMDTDNAIRMRTGAGGVPDIWAEMGGQNVQMSLADIDKARTTQAFARMRTAYAGNDATGFDNDDTLVALLMQGLAVPEEQFKRPWLLDSKRVTVGFAERHATDAANLDQSVTVGRAAVSLSLNVPAQDVGGVIIFTVEVLPERIDERMSDEWLMAQTFFDLPNALRDIQRVEPVDMVLNRRLDAAHTAPGALYGYEPMNDKWNRDFTRLGGDFYQADPGEGWTENRSNIWQTEIVDPTFSETHYLAPAPFPHDVFSDTEADAFEVVCRHMVSIVGLTQIGDVLAENNDDYDKVIAAGTINN